MEKQSQMKSMSLWSCLVHSIILMWSTNILCSNSAPTIPSSDRLALLAFKDKIHNDPLGALSSWNDSLHYCQWYGVTCSRRHPDRVTVLDFESQKLEGTLSPHIGNLSFLRTIKLAMNNFRGEIPQEVGRLFRLQILHLSNNSFVGLIPTNLTHCSNLRQLNLVDNKLSGKIPIELTSLPKLFRLYLGKNELAGSIPLSLANLSSLAYFSLSRNSFEGSIPDDLCRIQSFIFFQLSENNLFGMVPSCLYNLSRLKVISLEVNRLEGTLPPDIGLTLPNLQGLTLGNNTFRGHIPNSLSNSSKLEVISLSMNSFTGTIPMNLGMLGGLRHLSFTSNKLGTTSGNDLNFITSLTNCSNLKWLSIAKNSLEGSIPNSIANLSTQITNLLFRQNQIHGSIPVGVENMANLAILDFSSNYLTGNIRTVIGTLPKIQELFLYENQFSGQIPDSFNNSTLLTVFDVAENKLHGRIPPSLGNCSNLIALGLSDNRLNGTIPTQVIGLSSLRLSLNLSNNDFSGSLPSTVGELSNLVLLDISRNKLSGHVPDALGNCLALRYLKMDGNFFEGKIPETLKALKGIEYLYLSHNNLSGEIPEYLGEFTLLAQLDLSSNNLEGLVPTEGIFQNASAVSVVGNSKLCGGVTELKLPPCRVLAIKKKISPNLKVLIPVLVASLCLVLLSCLIFGRYSRRTSQNKPSSCSLSNRQYMKISYAKLLEATNNFSIDNLVGVGSYGSVYKGILDSFGTIVAVKVLNLQQQGASKSFYSECNALRNLRHRNLLKIITSCSSVDYQGNDFKALVFEFMPNGSLEEWLHRKRNGQHELRNLNFAQRLNIAIDVASALDYLHHHCQPPIVHCDLKPSNVLLDDDMTAHVADFGLAKILCATFSNSSRSQVSSIVVKGSLGYVAPEYGMGGEVSMQGDVYSYGILLLEMFIGKRPTDEMFQDGHNLHSFAKMTMPEHVMNIVDPKLLLKNGVEAIDVLKQDDGQVQIQECLLWAMKLGVTCSVELPKERANLRDILTELFRIRDHYQHVRSRSIYSYK